MNDIVIDDVLKAVLRTDFCAFVQKVFKTLQPGVDYEDNWHIEAIAWRLGEIERGNIKRLLITQPPRSLKSITTSVAWVAWCLGQNPSKSFLCISYSNDLAADLSAKFKLIVSSEWYKDLFPKTRFTKLTDGEAKTSLGGGRITTSIGGTLTGRGADIVIIDDPLKAEDAASETHRKRVIDWYQGTLMSRLNNQKHGAMLVVMQRLHEEDLAGHILAKDKQEETALEYTAVNRLSWDCLNLPAIAIEDEIIKLGETKYHRRKMGDVLHPAREGETELARLKKDLGSQRFSAQYQQSPLPLEGNLVKRKWLPKYDPAHVETLKKKNGARIVQSWDVATTTTNTSDWSVCTTWLKINKDYYLLHVLRVRKNFPDLKRLVVSHCLDHKAKTVLIERDGLGLNLYQELREDNTPQFPRPIGINVKGDKITRMEAQSAKIEAGQMHIPIDAAWLDIYLHELLGFPHGRHDDQVDSTSQFLNWVTAHQPTSVGHGGILFTVDGVIGMDDDFGLGLDID